MKENDLVICCTINPTWNLALVRNKGFGWLRKEKKIPRKNAKRDELGRFIHDPENPSLSRTRDYINEYNRNRVEQNRIVRKNWEQKNKEAYNAKRRAYRAKNKELHDISQRESHLRINYGITSIEYEQLLEKQNHSCFICEKHQSSFKKKLAVDHDHKTGEIRGLLCTHCNLKIIGRHRDPEVFKRAAVYLEREGTGWFVPKKKRKPKLRIYKKKEKPID